MHPNLIVRFIRKALFICFCSARDARKIIFVQFLHSCLKAKILFYFCVCVQMDLEPEGKIYICISLTGSFIDGKAADMLKSLSNKYLADGETKTSTFAIFPSPINTVWLSAYRHACMSRCDWRRPVCVRNARL